MYTIQSRAFMRIGDAFLFNPGPHSYGKVGAAVQGQCLKWTNTRPKFLLSFSSR